MGPAVGAGAAGLSVLKQLGEQHAAGESQQLDPYRIGRAAAVGGALGVGATLGRTEQALQRGQAMAQHVIQELRNFSAMGQEVRQAASAMSAAAARADAMMPEVEQVVKEVRSLKPEVQQAMRQAKETMKVVEDLGPGANEMMGEAGGMMQRIRQEGWLRAARPQPPVQGPQIIQQTPGGPPVPRR